MSAAQPLGSKLARDLIPGKDRICYTARQVEYNTFGSKHTPLSGDVVSVEAGETDTFTIFTPSGRLKPVSGDAEFEIIGPDYEQGVVQSKWWREAETFAGRSIE